MFLLSGLFLLFGLFGCFFCCLGRCVFYFLLFGRFVVCLCFFLLFGRGGRGGGRGVCFFLAVWAGACFHFCCLGGGRVYVFAVWAGGVFLFLLSGRGTGVHSLTGLPGSSLSDPTTKKTNQQKNNTGSC